MNEKIAYACIWLGGLIPLAFVWLSGTPIALGLIASFIIVMPLTILTLTIRGKKEKK